VPEVGVSELKTHALEILQDIQERNTRYLITHRGRPVGLLIPVGEVTSEHMLGGGEPVTATWGELVRLGEEIGRGWRSPLASTDLLSEMRR
jgi:antitoxin (DNA-binding transcriptional repressor) of toxin-antitoxin stability system